MWWTTPRDVVDAMKCKHAGCGGRLFVKPDELHIATARKPLIHQIQPVACYQHKKSAMYVIDYADRLTAQHSIVDISDWSWSYRQICYPSWHVKCFWPALAAHKMSSASYTSVLPQHPRWEIVPYRVGWNHLTIDFRGSVSPLIDTWLNMLMFIASEYGMFNF